MLLHLPLSAATALTNRTHTSYISGVDGNEKGAVGFTAAPFAYLRKESTSRTRSFPNSRTSVPLRFMRSTPFFVDGNVEWRASRPYDNRTDILSVRCGLNLVAHF